MNEDILREFLVKIGFKIDETSYKKFATSLEGITKSVLSLGATVAASATAVVVGTTVIANQLEKFYYAGQRTGETVDRLMALRYAASQIGVSADSAQGALENFSRTLRLNPGSQSLLKQLGVGSGSPEEQFRGMIASLSKMKPYIAAQYAAMFGVDPDTLLMLEQGLPKLEAEEKKYRERLKAFGLDPDKIAEQGKDFSNQMRALQSDLSILGLVIESKLMPVLGPMIDKFSQWLETHADKIADAIAKAFQRFGDWAAEVDWDGLFNKIDKIIDALGGFKGILYEIAAIKLIGVVTEVLSLVSALKALTVAGAAAGGSGILAGLLEMMPALGAAYAITHVGDLNEGEDAEIKKYHANDDKMRAGGSSSNNDPRGIRNNNPGNIRFGEFAKSQGATGQDAQGFAVFQNMESGKAASLALLRSYSARGYDTISKIISRWAPSSENNTSAYIEDVAKKLGISANQKLTGDQLNGVAGAIFAHENGRPLGADGMRSGSNVALSQTNNVTITGVSDPHKAAKEVGDQNRRFNADLVRNLNTAVA